MKLEEKNAIIDHLVTQLKGSKHFYITDISALNADDTSKLRRKCFDGNIKLIVTKNTLLRKALEKLDGNYEELYPVLTQSTSLMLTEIANSPARLIQEIRKTKDKPIVKAAFVEESVYIGDQVEALASLKSKDELIGDIIALLQSPAKTVVSQLQSGGNKLAGIVKTLSEKKE